MAGLVDKKVEEERKKFQKGENSLGREDGDLRGTRTLASADIKTLTLVVSL